MLKLPNIRKLFLPDRGHVICDVDLSGADAQVVAWEAGDDDLKTAFKSRIDVHNKNGQDILGEAYVPDKVRGIYTMRDACKRTTHGTNYVGRARTIAKTIGWSTWEVEAFQLRWFAKHPGIREWHRRVDRDLQIRRMVQNQFGYRIIYFDRPDNLLPKGLAWIPQSTIAGVTARAAVALRKECPWADLLLQVHDSLVFQLPIHRHDESSLARIEQSLSVEIPYPGDPLIIPWGLATSEKSWGDVQKRKWENV